MAEALSFFPPATLITPKLFINGRPNPNPKLIPSFFPSLSSRRYPISCLSSHGSPSLAKPIKTLLFSEGRDEDEARLVCPGCGVFMQDEDPNLPGFFIKPSSKSLLDADYPFCDSDDVLEDEEDVSDVDSVIEGFVDGDEEKVEGIDWDSDWDREFEIDEKKLTKELDGFAPAGVGYGNVTEDTLERMKKEKISKAEKKRRARERKRREAEECVLVCARCHSLRNYGQVKNQNVENLIPDFDFDRFITTRLMKPATVAPLVVVVVDCVDFDGSFPKRAVKSLFRALEGGKKNPRLSKLPKLVLVATKVDLLPSQISPARLDRWVRNRAKAAGAPKLNGVYLVSARKDLGVRNLLAFIKESAGPRGNVWVIGAQNAGKSTLINTFAKKEGMKITRLTEAAVPGTTLGILRIGGILPAKAKMYDTPGLLQPNLMTMRLNREEQKMVEIRKELKPRSYRMKVCLFLPFMLRLIVV